MKNGTLVKYWKGIKSGEPSGVGKIKASGDMCGSEVVWIEGCSGCIAVTHIEKV